MFISDKPKADDPQGANSDLDFTGERVIPGKVDSDLFNEHFARYLYAKRLCVGQKVLDTGCGVGYGSAKVAEVAAQVVGVDIDPQAIEYARGHYQPANSTFVAGDCQQLPFATGSFDVVTSFELIEHLPDASIYLKEVKRVLRPDGTLIVSTPNRPVYDERREGIPNPFHVREWELEEFVSLLKTCFSFVEVLGEKHLSAIGILGSVTGRPIPVEVEEGHGPASADYFVCVCSQRNRDLADLVFVPASANVLVERERHIRALEREVSIRDAHLNRLKPEFEEKAAWAEKLDAELAQTRDDYTRMEQQAQEWQSKARELGALWSKATRWKRALAFGLLMPLDWTIGFSVLLTEFVARILRLIYRRGAPTLPVSDATRCSIIVLSWEGKDLLAESLPPLLNAIRAHGVDHEVIVLDNGSTDGTSEYVHTNFPDVRVVRSEQNIFYTGGNNLGVREAKHDIVVLLNNDMLVHEDFLAPLLAGFKSADVFAVGSQVFLADPTKRREETGKTRVSFNGCDLDWRHETILPSDEQQQYVPVFWGHGGAVALDRRKFLWLGGIDTLYDPFYVEDSDLSYAAWKVGWRCLLAVQSKVIHKHRGTNQPRYGHEFISQIIRRNQQIFIWKNFTDIPKLARHFAFMSRRRMRVAGIPGIGIKRELKAYFGAAERLPRILRRRLRMARFVTRTDEQILQETNTPPEAAISSSDIDFSKGGFQEQLGSGWHQLESSGDRHYRWMGAEAWVFLRVPAPSARLLVQGLVPLLSAYQTSSLLLNISCNGQQHRLWLQGGDFEGLWQVNGLPAGLPIEVRLSVNHTLKSSLADTRILGAIVRRIGLLTEKPEHSAHSSLPTSGKPSSYHCEGGVGMPLHPEGKRVLMVCAYMPCTGSHGGGNMMFHLIQELSKRHRLTVLCFYDQDAELEYAAELAPYCEDLEVVFRGQNFDTADPFGIKPPEIIYEFYHQSMERLVRRYLDKKKFDIFQCEFLQTAHFANLAPQIPSVLTNHEVLSLSYRQRYQNLSWPTYAKTKALVAWMRMLNYEISMLERFWAVVVLTPQEEDFLTRYAPKVKVFRRAMGVDTDYFSPREARAETHSLVFVGSFRHAPNANGILWFLEHVWRRVRERYPAACLYIVGGNPTPPIQSWNGQENVVVTGWVRDVRPYLERAAVVMAPMFEGAGMRTKVLEAWAMGKPVVGTRLSFEGLVSENDGLFQVADNADAFVERISDLLQEPETARSLGDRARQVVSASFSWAAFAEMYDKIYQQISPASQQVCPEPVIATPA